MPPGSIVIPSRMAPAAFQAFSKKPGSSRGAACRLGLVVAEVKNYGSGIKIGIVPGFRLFSCHDCVPSAGKGREGIFDKVQASG